VVRLALSKVLQPNTERTEVRGRRKEDLSLLMQNCIAFVLLSLFALPPKQESELVCSQSQGEKGSFTEPSFTVKLLLSTTINVLLITRAVIILLDGLKYPQNFLNRKKKNHEKTKPER
jgi:hypothetical protein